MTVLYRLVLYGVEPLLLLATIGYAFFGPGRVPIGGVPGEPPFVALRRAAMSGAAAGLVIGLLYVVVAATSETTLIVTAVSYVGLNGFDGVVFGLAGALTLAVVYEKSQRAKRVGFVCLSLTTVAAVSLFNLYFSPPLAMFTLTFVLSATLGVLIGVLMHSHGLPAGSTVGGAGSDPSTGDVPPKADDPAPHDPRRTRPARNQRRRPDPPRSRDAATDSPTDADEESTPRTESEDGGTGDVPDTP